MIYGDTWSLSHPCFAATFVMSRELAPTGYSVYIYIVRRSLASRASFLLSLCVYVSLSRQLHQRALYAASIYKFGISRVKNVSRRFARRY